MRIRSLKSHWLALQVNNLVIDLAAPSNLSYHWNWGSLLGAVLVLQLLSGLFLSIHYNSATELAFFSVERIIREINGGWLLRYSHAIGASIFFFAVYCHIAKAIYYGSYLKPRIFLWNLGIILFFLLIGVGFIGYVLPWSAIGFWGSTVITTIITAIPVIGQEIVLWIWGGFSVDFPTLNRFFSFHFVLPFVLAGAVILHIAALHKSGSGNPIGINISSDIIPFYPYYTSKDVLGIFLFMIFIGGFLFFSPNSLGHADGYTEANPLVTPSLISPEIYFLSFYAILRSIPSKLGGVLAIVFAILILGLQPFLHTANIKSHWFKPISKVIFWSFVANFLLLTILGAKHAEEPYIFTAQISTLFYFSYFLILIPIIGKIEEKLSII